MLTVIEWCRSRSRTAVAITGSPKTSADRRAGADTARTHRERRYGSRVQGGVLWPTLMAQIGERLRDWGRYDDVAAPYASFVAANGYSALARDLVAALELLPGALILDVGCGSGVVAESAQEAVGAGGLVVGLDASLAMLRRASACGALLVA